MTPAADVFELIKKMSKTEKRYFTLNANVQDGDKAYLTLFQEMDKMLTYDETKLKKRLQFIGWNTKHFAVTKTNLSKLILRSLRGYNEGNSPEHRILSMLLEAEILKNKGLYKMAIRQLEKAKATAQEFEMHFHIFEIINRLTSIHVTLSSTNRNEKLEALFIELDHLKKIASREAELKGLAFRISSILSSKPLRDSATIDEIKQMEQMEVVRQIEPDDTFFARISYFLFHAFAKHAKRQYQDANPIFKKILEIWNAYPHIRDINNRTYKSHIANYLNSCHTIGAYEVFDEWLDKFERIPDTNFDEEAGSFKDLYHIKLLYLLNTMQMEKAVQMATPIKDGLAKFGERITKARETTLKFNVFLAFFIDEKFSEALDWLLTMDLGGKLEAKADSRTLARILSVIVHYELKHTRILDDLRASIYRKLRKMNQLHEFERAVLDHIRQLEQAFDKKEKSNLYKALILNLNQIGETYGVNKIAGLEEVICWAECRIQNKPYLEVLKARKKG